MGKRATLQRTALAIAATVAICALFSLAPLSRPAAAQSSSRSVAPPDWQTAAGGKMAFETATVTLNTMGPKSPSHFNFPLGPGDVYIPNEGLFSAGNQRLARYILFAYKITPNQEPALLAQLPKWVWESRFDIQATAEGNPTKDQMRLMMQTLLADRFHLVVHYESREVPVLALVVDQPGKLGPLLQKHPDDSPCPTDPFAPSPPPTAEAQTVVVDTRFPITCGGIDDMTPSAPGRSRAGARNISMDLIANSMTEADTGMNRPVVNKTGLTGGYDVALEFVPDGEKSTDGTPGPNFREALKEQLGLRLEPQTAPMTILVVDSIDQLRPN